MKKMNKTGWFLEENDDISFYIRGRKIGYHISRSNNQTWTLFCGDEIVDEANSGNTPADLRTLREIVEIEIGYGLECLDLPTDPPQESMTADEQELFDMYGGSSMYGSYDELLASGDMDCPD